MDSIEDVSDWLRHLGYERFIQQFVDNEIDAEVLPDLDINDLAAMHIPIGPAKKILRAIASLDTQDTTSASVSGTAVFTHSSRGQPDSMLRDAERRQVTIMFCDMVGSTALTRLSTSLRP